MTLRISNAREGTGGLLKPEAGLRAGVDEDHASSTGRARSEDPQAHGVAGP